MRASQGVPLFGSEIVAEWPCARCERPTAVTAECMRFARSLNHALATRNEPPLPATTLCTRCARIWSDERREHAEREERERVNELRASGAATHQARGKSLMEKLK